MLLRWFLAAISVAGPALSNTRYERHFVTSNGLQVALHRVRHDAHPKGVVLFVHGATFPTMLSAGYRLHGMSWMEDFARRGFDVWGLDFLGYGVAERYPAMREASPIGDPLGSASEASAQIADAIEFICSHTRRRDVMVVAHSWGTLPLGVLLTRPNPRVAKAVFFGPIMARNGAGAVRLPIAVYDDVTRDDQWRSFTNGVPPGREPGISAAAFDRWFEAYLQSDAVNGGETTPARGSARSTVRVPGGPAHDIVRTRSGSLPYDPAQVRVPVLIIRGSWDAVTTGTDSTALFEAMTGTPKKRLVWISEGTHRIHLETNRRELYDEIALFLQSE